MEIRKYTGSDETALMTLIADEGKDWSCYSAEHVSEMYKRLLRGSITYVAYDGDCLCGYSRSLIDGDFYIYVCDLLVSPKHRGREIGKQLMECIYKDYPHHTVFVMSGVDGYYEKLGYSKEGSIFEVPNTSAC